ncbi:MAG: ribonuclease Z [Chloroflexi bacterium]|nr:ribonuclease Z [Chloroflexota bacterium]
MSIVYQVLGKAGHDNALFVWVTSGQAIHRLLFDCGENCVAEVPYTDVLAIDHLFFSHLHMDHIGGFDTFFRSVFNRTSRRNAVWGPPGTSRIMHHRFRGFLWNLNADQPGQWFVHDIYPDYIDRFRYDVSEAFERAHIAGREPHRLPCHGMPQGYPARSTQRGFGRQLLDEATFTVEALHMEHAGPSLAYLIREKPRFNVDRAKLAELGLQPGPWLERVKVRRADEASLLELDGATYELAALRETLLVEKPGESLAYLTDFILDQAALEQLVPALHGYQTLICESQYCHADALLAQRNFHMTAVQAAELARQAQVERLILFHISDRYDRREWLALLDEARAIFPNTTFPQHWGLTEANV